jgi:hypothetical protein
MTDRLGRPRLDNGGSRNSNPHSLWHRPYVWLRATIIKPRRYTTYANRLRTHDVTKRTTIC